MNHTNATNEQSRTTPETSEMPKKCLTFRNPDNVSWNIEYTAYKQFPEKELIPECCSGRTASIITNMAEGLTEVAPQVQARLCR